MTRNLDILRAFAVSCVLAAHTVLTFRPGGYKAALIGRLGVLLFFVHTALVLMMSIERHGQKEGWVSRFYVRRIFRIYPLAIVCLAIVLLVHAPPSPREHFVFPPGSQILKNFLLIQNFWPEHSILAPMWSLPYELQMYVFLPAIFLVLRTGARQRWLRLSVLFAACVSLSDAHFSWLKNSELFLFFPCFMGGIVAWQVSKNRRLRGRIPGWLFLMTLATFAGAYSLAAMRHDYNDYQWLLCLALGAAVPLFRAVQSPAITAWAARIAKYSYGIYLAHSPLLWAVFVVAPLNIVWKWPLFALSLTISTYALFRWIEKPMIDLGAKLANPNSTAPLLVKEDIVSVP